jgi:hypothetical protein
MNAVNCSRGSVICVNRRPSFDGVNVHPPVPEACARTCGRFKLGTLLARALRLGAPVQALHADFPAAAGG